VLSVRARQAFPIAVLAAAVASGCGGSGEDSSAAPPPTDPDAPVSGTLRLFAYSDTASDVILDPFRQRNPDLDLKTATFDSVQEGAAKLAGGFEADVVNVCSDEYQPLVTRNLLRPIDPKGIQGWDQLAFRDNEGVERSDGLVNFVPVAAGPQGLIYDTEQVSPPPDSWADLFDPAYAGRVTIDGGTWLTPIAETAMAQGVADPMKLTDEQVEAAKQELIDSHSQFRAFTGSDAEKLNLFKGGEVVLADGGRYNALLLRAEGLPVEWVAPKEGPLSWVCGLGITSKAENIDAAYALINYFVSPPAQAIAAQNGFAVVNPAAVADVPARYRETADPRSITDAIAEVQPDNFQSWIRAWQEVRSG
jgi:spermidine/putrescine transport system substrate-binding protein